MSDLWITENSMNKGYRIGLLAAMIFVFGGCRTAPPRHEPAVGGVDTVEFRGDPPVMVFIVKTTISGEPYEGYPAEIVLPPHRSLDTNNIQLTISGCVRSPGVFEVRGGTSVLEGIVSAEGFEPGANIKFLRITPKNGKAFRIYLQSRRENSNFRKVWYEVKSGEPNLSPKDSRGLAASDYVLKEGDRIDVDRSWW